MRRLGALHRHLDHDDDTQTARGVQPLDLSMDDEALGRAVWEQVKADSELMIERGNAGYEMTLTCPKSLSVAALLAPADTRDAWLELVRDASRGALDELMARVAHGRSGHEGDGQVAPAIRGDGYAATVSIESHSRALDPHLHGHVMIPNRVLCVDGKERAIATGGADLVNHAWWLQAEFERRLRALSVERGLIDSWEMDLATGQWEVTGADPDILAFYSQGKAAVRAEINADLDARGLAMSKAELVMLDSRAKRKVTGRKDDQQLTWDADRRPHAHPRGRRRDRTHAGIRACSLRSGVPARRLERGHLGTNDRAGRLREQGRRDHRPHRGGRPLLRPPRLDRAAAARPRLHGENTRVHARASCAPEDGWGSSSTPPTVSPTPRPAPGTPSPPGSTPTPTASPQKPRNGTSSRGGRTPGGLPPGGSSHPDRRPCSGT